MLKKLLLTTLLSISVFGVEIVVDKTSQMPQSLIKKKEMALQRAKREYEWNQEERKRHLERQKAYEKANRYQRDNEKEVVLDTKLNIMWQDNKAAKSVKKPWDAIFSETANEYCQELELGGYNDWYLPNIKELESIIDISNGRNGNIKKRFNNTVSGRYWSSSSNVSNSKYAWIVNFHFGYSRYGPKTPEYYVRCARAG